MSAVELDSPPADPVEWLVRGPGSEGIHGFDGKVMGWTDAKIVFAPTAWAAHVAACPELMGSPPFGSCMVTRLGGGQ